MRLSVVLITHNEEANIGRTLKSLGPLVRDGAGEIIIVDSGSTDRTVAIAKSFDVRIFEEPWEGFAAQKNSAIEKASGDWILSLDADEEVDADLQQALLEVLKGLDGETVGFWIRRKNFFLGRWIKHGGFFPDPKLRFFRRGAGRFEERAVHETLQVEGKTGTTRQGALLHHAYPTLSSYIDHMNRYSSLSAQMAVDKGRSGFSFFNIILRPTTTFLYNYILRLGFLDGHEGLLLHIYHSVYVSWKYAKVWELSRAGGPSKS